MTTLEKLSETTSLKARLLAFPATLAQARLDAEATKARSDAAKDAWKEIEAEVMLFVAGETNGGGKPKFGNEAARKAEVKRRLTTEAGYAAAARAVTETTAAWIQSRIAVEQIEDEHRAAIAVKDLTVAEIDLLIHGR